MTGAVLAAAWLAVSPAVATVAEPVNTWPVTVPVAETLNAADVPAAALRLPPLGRPMTVGPVPGPRVRAPLWT